jgi:cytidine deaminase
VDLLVLDTTIDTDPRFWAPLAGDRVVIHLGPPAGLRAVVTSIENARADHAGRRPLVLLPWPGPAVLARLRETYRENVWLVGGVPPVAAAAAQCDFLCATTDPTSRLLSLLDGRSTLGPTRDEQGMYFAAVAALRSAGLRGQAGAALCDASGELVAVGTNEVPSAGGGQYWTGAEPDGRDVARFGHDFATAERARDLDGVLCWLRDAALLDESAYRAATELAADPDRPGPAILRGDARGRVVHAEEAALLSAARRGVGVAGCTAYATHLPCHLCLRHLVAAGAGRVVYLRPGDPADLLRRHGDAVSVDGSTDRVPLLPFAGVAPHGYPRVFARPRPAVADRSGQLARLVLTDVTE